MRSWKDALQEYLKIYLYEKNINESVIQAKEENLVWKNREKCRLCNSTKLQTFFKLQPTPQANHFVKKPIFQKVIPLDICICNHCNHIQLVQIVDQSFQYSTYLYITSASKTMVSHIISNIESFLQRFSTCTKYFPTIQRGMG
jgi:hypothetical protein